MKWFDRWFARKCKWAWDNKDMLGQDITAEQVKTRGQGMMVVEESPGWQDGLRMNVKKVIGGYVISFRTYDRKHDRSDERHYIITDEQDFNAELGKTITLESMRQT